MKQYRYPGAQPFATSQEHIFFGREQDMETLYRLIRLEPLVVLYSKSGLGKSSLLNAGLIPRVLADDKYQPVKIRFNAYAPNSDTVRLPLDTTREAVIAAGEKTEQPTFLEAILPNEDSLWHLLKEQQVSHKNNQLLLLFDQFEELFTYPEQAIQDFKQQLAELINPQIPQRFLAAVEKEVENPTLLTPAQLALLHQPFDARIVFAIRSDRMSLLDKLADYLPDVKRSWYELGALQPEQAEDAILNPAYKKGAFASPIFDYSDEAIKKMLDFLTKEGDQKIESFQLQILCQAIERKVIRQQLKMVTAADLGNIEKIYENYYDDQIRLIEDPTEQLAARRFIEEGLIFEEEERRLSLYEGQIFRQYGLSESLLRKLEDTHLIRREPSMKGGYTYELSHDTLVAPVLRAKELRLAEERQAQEEAERQRKEQELAEARQKAEEERQLRENAERNEQKARQRTRLAAILSLVAIVLALLAGFSYLQAIQANKRVVLSFLKDADAHILDLDYEAALDKTHTAAGLKLEKEAVFTRYFELAYWYNESGDSQRATGILDTALTYSGKKQLLASLPAAPSRKDLQNTLQTLDKALYTRLQSRYYPYMIDITGGTFEMGCDPNELKRAYGEDRECPEDETQHDVELSDYSLAETETTFWQFGLYCAATDRNIDEFRPNWLPTGDHPIVNVSWYDALEYANWLSEQQGLESVYTIDKEQPDTNNKSNYDDLKWLVIADTLAYGFRLPTEAEWEYAARANQPSLFAGVSSPDSLYLFANYSDDSGAKDGYQYTAPAKTYRPNNWGLYDMSGNVREWCWDWYGEYPQSAEKNYFGPEEGKYRVLRGGSWSDSGSSCRSASRDSYYPDSRDDLLGFRLSRAR